MIGYAFDNDRQRNASVESSRKLSRRGDSFPRTTRSRRGTNKPSSSTPIVGERAAGEARQLFTKQSGLLSPPKVLLQISMTATVAICRDANGGSFNCFDDKVGDIAESASRSQPLVPCNTRRKFGTRISSGKIVRSVATCAAR